MIKYILVEIKRGAKALNGPLMCQWDVSQLKRLALNRAVSEALLPTSWSWTTQFPDQNQPDMYIIPGLLKCSVFNNFLRLFQIVSVLLCKTKCSPGHKRGTNGFFSTLT